jgi:hypothetical protein
LVSAEAILMEVGDRSCEASASDSPLSRRLATGYAVSSFFTRNAYRRFISPKAFGQEILDAGRRIPGLEDAGCKDNSVRYARLLLNAPQVHSRCTGKLKGVVIAEVALFRLSKSTFAFDPVFRDVPVLPLLKNSDCLVVE